MDWGGCSNSSKSTKFAEFFFQDLLQLGLPKAFAWRLLSHKLSVLHLAPLGLTLQLLIPMRWKALHIEIGEIVSTSVEQTAAQHMRGQHWGQHCLHLVHLRGFHTCTPQQLTCLHLIGVSVSRAFAYCECANELANNMRHEAMPINADANLPELADWIRIVIECIFGTWSNYPRRPTPLQEQFQSRLMNHINLGVNRTSVWLCVQLYV